MIKTLLSASVFSALATIALASTASADLPNMSGTYRCEASGDGCKWSGSTFTVNQTGNVLDAKNDKGDIGSGHMTSPITVSMGPPWNMFGVIHEGNTIEWSNGTQWRKQ
jgi:hypothetical protein